MSGDLNWLEGKTALFIVSSGGHLQEALQLRHILKLSKDSHFITHSNPQTISLLIGKSTCFVKNIESRAWGKMLLASPKVYRFSRRIEYDLIISTGAAIALSAVPTHLISRKKFYYFESLTRVVKPSLTGKILELIPTIKRFSPSASNFSSKWKLGPNILENFRVNSLDVLPPNKRILVTVGTISNYRFDRLIDFVLQIIQPDDRVTWQIGCTERSDLPGEVHATIPKDYLLKIAKESDVVFSHCGIGTMMDLLEIGVRPMVMTRLTRYQEHIDDHQVEALQIFTKLDLALEVTEDLSKQYIYNSARKRIIKIE